MSNRNLLTRISALTICLVLLAGCAAPSARHSTAAVPASTQRPECNVTLPQSISKPPAPFEGEGWKPMFDGKTLSGWRETDFAGHGPVACQSGVIVLGAGDPFTGINWTNPFPKTNYEVAFDAMRITGSDFFCGLTVPVGDSFCTLIVGGWGGSLVGISSLDDMDASENETAKTASFASECWYRICLRVTEKKIQAWIDNEKLVDVNIVGRRVSLRPGEIEQSAPFGLASWCTTAAVREIRMRSLK
jgi:hypothetical protein